MADVKTVPTSASAAKFVAGIADHQQRMDAEVLLAQLGTHSVGKGCLYIKRLSDVDLKVLRSLLEASAERPRR